MRYPVGWKGAVARVAVRSSWFDEVHLATVPPETLVSFPPRFAGRSEQVPLSSTRP